MPLEIRFPVLAIAFAALYFVLAYGALLIFDDTRQQASPVWLASGFAVFVVYRYGQRFAVSVFIGAALANYTYSAALLSSLGIGLGNAIQALVVPLLFTGLDSRTDLLKFAFGAVIGASIAATNGAVIWLGAESDTWLTWFLGDLAGIIILFPLLYAPTTFNRNIAVDAAATAATCIPIFLFNNLSLAYDRDWETDNYPGQVA